MVASETFKYVGRGRMKVACNSMFAHDVTVSDPSLALALASAICVLNIALDLSCPMRAPVYSAILLDLDL